MIGSITLFLALYAFQLLPINYAGFLLIIIGIIFMIAEVFFPSFGSLGFGGIVSFVIGSFLLFDTETPGFTLPWSIIAGVAITTSIFMLGLVQLLVRSRFKPVVSGTQTLIEKTGLIEKDGNHFWVIVQGERWSVVSNDALHDKQSVKIVRVDGLTLVVEPLNKQS